MADQVSYCAMRIEGEETKIVGNLKKKKIKVSKLLSKNISMHVRCKLNLGSGLV